jgi:HemY protein
MAHIEGGQNGDKGRLREWLARAVNAPRDPAWTADGIVADHWAPTSPVTGALDAFQWKVPVETIDQDGALLASKLEELVKLGAPGSGGTGSGGTGSGDHGSGSGGTGAKASDAPTRPARAAPVRYDDVPETIEAVPVTERGSDRQRPAKSQTASATVPATGAKGPPQEAARAETALRTGTGRGGQRRAVEHTSPDAGIFTAQHAPDDPGPVAGETDDLTLPLRPKTA